MYIDTAGGFYLIVGAISETSTDLIFLSDRGDQYDSFSFRAALNLGLV